MNSINNIIVLFQCVFFYQPVFYARMGLGLNSELRRRWIESSPRLAAGAVPGFYNTSFPDHSRRTVAGYA